MTKSEVIVRQSDGLPVGTELWPVRSPEDLPKGNCREVRYCPHVQNLEDAKFVGCDDCGVGLINWVLVCDNPECIRHADAWVKESTIDWDQFRKGSREEIRKMINRR